MFIDKEEKINLEVRGAGRIKFLQKLGFNPCIGEFIGVPWYYLKTSSLRRYRLKLKCDDCGEEFDNRIKNLNENIDKHYCYRCILKGERNPGYGKIPWNKDKKFPQFSGENNPARRKEVRKKISLANTGKISPMLGKHHSSRTKNKISKSNKGKKLSEETIIKIKNFRKLQIGEKCPGWKNGISDRIYGIRHGVTYKKWRDDIFKRDNYICKKCNRVGGKLESHHIIGVGMNISLIYKTDNGITLCEKCHSEFHNKFGKKIFPSILEIYKIKL